MRIQKGGREAVVRRGSNTEEDGEDKEEGGEDRDVGVRE